MQSLAQIRLCRHDNCRFPPCDNSRMSSSTGNLDVIRKYLKSIEDGAFSDLAARVTSDIVMSSFPIASIRKAFAGPFPRWPTDSK